VRDKVFDSKWNAVFLMETVVRKWLAASRKGGRIMNSYTIEEVVCMSNCGNLDSAENKDTDLRFWQYFGDYHALFCAKYNYNRPTGFLSHGMMGLRFKLSKMDQNVPTLKYQNTESIKISLLANKSTGMYKNDRPVNSCNV
jgi:hypothetical protein